jgi:hypothetical protein
MSRLGACIVDAYLEHRKAALQFDRTVFCAFLGAELGLEPSVYLDGKTEFRQFDRAAGHSKIRCRWRQFSHLVTVSPARPASLFLWLWKEEYAHERFVRPPALRGRPGDGLPAGRAGLGFNAMAQRFAIGSRAEAAAYLEHDLLGPRLVECTRLVMATSEKTITDILGSPDDMKLRS